MHGSSDCWDHLLVRLTLAAAVGLAGCGAPPQPVAEVSVGTAVVPLGFPEMATLGVRWKPEKRLEAEAWVFVHLLGEDGEVLRTFDHPFPAEWRPGRWVADEVELYQSALGPPLPPGTYRLTLGLYRRGGDRWALKVAAPEVGSQEYEVAKVVVPEPSPDSLRFELPGRWLPLEAGGDLQILGRRWLVGEGQIGVEGLRRPGVARMVLLIPDDAETGGRLVLDPEADEPAVHIHCSCSGGETVITGAGDHVVDMPLASLPEDEACTIFIVPNFSLLLPQTLDRRSVRLELLAWRPEK